MWTFKVGITVDLDENRHVVGIEILDASRKLSLSDMVNISIQNLPLENVAQNKSALSRFQGTNQEQHPVKKGIVEVPLVLPIVR
jgi:hypothetical protein